MLSTLFIALLLPSAGVYFVLKKEYDLSEKLVYGNLVAQANAYKNTLTPALLFEDSATAGEIIETICYNPLILEADLWIKQDEEIENSFALFASSNASKVENLPQVGEIWNKDFLALTTEIRSGAKTLGYFSLKRSLNDLNTRKEQSIGFGLISLAVILFVVLLITLWFQSSLTFPLKELMTVAEKITQEKDYRLRVKEFGSDEFGRLTKLFNQMMESLNDSDRKLRKLNNEMEDQVRFRTEELSETNTRLVEEINSREKTHTELLKTREKLTQQQNLASVGQVSSNIAHELRNPMAAIRNAVYFLRKHFTIDSKAIQQLDLIDSQLSQSDEVIERLLELTKGKKLKVTQTDLSKLAQDAFALSNPTQNVELLLKIDSALGQLEVDALLFRQILNNLFTNSIQSMPHGGIVKLLCSRKDKTIEIRVIDSGIGIASELWEKIFDPLFTKRKHGIGLGLSLCKELIERHGGKIAVESSSDVGSCFLITLPHQQHQPSEKLT